MPLTGKTGIGETDLRIEERHLAEAVRFELTDGCPSPVFKTGAIDHSATLPCVPMVVRRAAL